MTKEAEEKKKKGLKEKEAKTEKQINKNEKKNEVKRAKELIIQEKSKIEEKIDDLVEEKHTTNDKTRKKEIKKEIKKLKQERKNIGKRDTYFRDVKKEMSMVRWPSRTEIVKYSLASFIFIVFFALLFFGIDALFALVKDLID